MSQLDEIVDDAAARFGLGTKAGALLQELQQLVTASPGGVGGFVDKLQAAGLSREVSGWLGNTDGLALTPSQVERAFGSGTVDTIARKVGLPAGTAAAAIGYLTPKLVGHLTSDSVIDAGIPGSASDAISRSPVPYAVTAPKAPASSARWILPLLALLLAGGLGWYALANRTPASVETKTEAASKIPSRLAIANDNGMVSVSGVVRDQASRSAILDALKSAFGSNNVKGDVTINPNVAPSPWLADLPRALAQMNQPGLQARFEGSSINLDGAIGDADRERILGALKSLFGSAGMTFAAGKSMSAAADHKSTSAAADQMSGLATDAQSKVFAALSALGPRFQTTDLLDILNMSIINFPTGSADIPAASRALLQQAAMSFKQVPAGTVIEISGHTDNTGDSHANLRLSQSRADAVKNALTQAGVNPAMLVAKGYGDTNPVANNDTAEGRLQNRRIGYQVAKSATVGSGR